MLAIQQAQTKIDAEKIAQLAASIWTEHYTSILGADQVTYMLEALQSKAAIYRSIQEGQSYWLVFFEQQAVGYVSYRLLEDQLFLSKLYLKRSVRGRGLGKQLLQRIIEVAETNKKHSITLTVNKQNKATIAAYTKMGFEIIRQEIADIGEGFVMDDFVMELSLSNKK